jgi:uncharacterized protein (TIGR03067 family)
MHALLMSAAGLLVAADAPKEEAARKEFKRLEGTWVMVSGQRDGEKIADEHAKNRRITWKGREVVVVTPHQSKEAIRGTVTVDPTKRPREMDWVRSAGPDAGRAHHAIYEFLGEDEYRVCFAPPGKGRPRDFKAEAGSGHTLHVWKRARK